jgi:hypothetical protein
LRGFPRVRGLDRFFGGRAGVNARFLAGEDDSVGALGEVPKGWGGKYFGTRWKFGIGWWFGCGVGDSIGM